MYNTISVGKDLMHEIGWLSILPPLAAIILAISTRQVIIALWTGIWLGWTFLSDYNPFLSFVAAAEACIKVFQDSGNTKVILFCMMVGSLILLMERSGGTAGFVAWIQKRQFGRSRKGAQLLAVTTGALIFVESSISCLVTGSIARPLFKNLKLSREKLAYICDSTSAPVCILIPFNGWGAFIMGLLAAQQVDHPLQLMLATIPYNFYAIFTLILMMTLILSGKDFGPMKSVENLAASCEVRQAPESLPSTQSPITSPKARYMLLPLVTLIAMVPIGLYMTGDSDMMKGSGSSSVFYAVIAANFAAGLLIVSNKLLSVSATINTIMEGMSQLLPLGILMLFAFAIGDTCKALGTGPYLATLSQDFLSPGLLPAVLFIFSAIIAFATGTSWGTFATMIPIGLPMAVALDADLALTVAAILSGGVFGDHASPLSDTTIISALAADCETIAHVRTQLPYALLAATATFIAFLLFS